jgi:hypothetical protein
MDDQVLARALTVLIAEIHDESDLDEALVRVRDELHDRVPSVESLLDELGRRGLVRLKRERSTELDGSLRWDLVGLTITDAGRNFPSEHPLQDGS